MSFIALKDYKYDLKNNYQEQTILYVAKNDISYYFFKWMDTA